MISLPSITTPKVAIIMETQTKADEFFMRAAIEQARMALDRGEVPIGAVVVCGGAIVGRGHNLVESLSDATAHAEMQAITAASGGMGGKYLNECTLYVTLEPCAMCGAACGWSQMGRVVYGASDPKKGYSTVGGQLLHPKTAVAAGVLEGECSDMLSNFFEKLRRR